MRRALSLVFVMVAACGDDAVHHLPDGPHADVDAAIDGALGVDAWALPPVAVATHVVSSIGTTAGDPAPSIRVVAIVANAIVDDVTSDATGHATLAHVPHDALVAAIYPGTPTVILTIAGVEPGDALDFGERYFDYQTTTGTMAVTWPAVANASNYFVQSRCSGTYVTPPATSATLPACGNTPIVLVAYQNAVDSEPASGYLAPASYGAGATVALPSWIAQTSTLSVGVTGAASDITTVDFATHLGLAPLFGQDFELVTSRAPVAGAASVANLAIPAAVPGAIATAMVGLHRAATTGTQYAFFAGTGASPWNTVAPTLPFVDAPTLSATGLDWTQTAGALDAITVRVASYSHAGAGYRWQGIFPPSTTHLDLPTVLPLPTTTDTLGPSGIVVRAIDFPAADYAAIRTQPFGATVDPRSSVIWGAVPYATFSTTENRPDNW